MNPPTVDEIINQLHCLGDYDGFGIDSAEAHDGPSRVIEGVTDDGIPFRFKLTVSEVTEG